MDAGGGVFLQQRWVARHQPRQVHPRQHPFQRYQPLRNALRARTEGNVLSHKRVLRSWSGERLNGNSRESCTACQNGMTCVQQAQSLSCMCTDVDASFRLKM